VEATERIVKLCVARQNQGVAASNALRAGQQEHDSNILEERGGTYWPHAHPHPIISLAAIKISFVMLHHPFPVIIEL
jgi:hypothetical protein